LELEQSCQRQTIFEVCFLRLKKERQSCHDDDGLEAKEGGDDQRDGDEDSTVGSEGDDDGVDGDGVEMKEIRLTFSREEDYCDGYCFQIEKQSLSQRRIRDQRLEILTFLVS
jgi:hypothetical protein